MTEPTHEPSPASATSDEELLGQLADDFAARRRRGEHPTADEYIAKHPPLAERIRKVLSAAAMMEQTVPLDLAVGERIGGTIGRYKLLERIGEGGFGVVHMAEQITPVRRRVALKVLKPGMDSRQVLARFEAERQALAIMDHPNIARVFDAGATDAGRPYFVMELVKGVPITEFCDQQQLTPRARLELFAHVCHAVQHAHQKGIIHRDIKPTNVLVMMHDTEPVVKVIDFGIAKALGQELTEKTLFTGFAQLLGTPLYMSPEQAGQSAIDVDTRSDIYSLGVLLYELLTGSTPFDKERFRKAAQDEMRRIIREEEPPRPSTRLSESKGTLASISAQRHTEPAKLTKLVQGELDWIVMKALEKDRSRRYETANGFAKDLERYLNEEAVQACPPSAVYRFRKFARRNRAAVATASAAVAGLVLLVAGLAVSNRMITASRNETAAALREKELALAAAKASAAQADAQRIRAEDNLRQARYETAVRQLNQQSLAGNFEEGEARVRECIAVFEDLQRERTGDPEYQQQVAWSHTVLSRILFAAGRPRDAEVVAQRATDLYKPLLVPRGDATVADDCVYGAIIACRVKAAVLRSDGRVDEADRMIERALAIHERNPGAVPADAAIRQSVAKLYFELADMRIANGRLKDAADLYARGLKFDPDPHWQWYQLAVLYLSVGDVERYRGVCREMLDRFEKRAETVPQAAEINAKTCALMPRSVPDFSRVERLADRLMSEKEHTYFRHFVLTKGLVDHRAGRHTQAVESLHRYGPNAGGTHWDATAFAALAMAQHGLDDHDQARSALGAARAIIAAKPADGMSGPYWFDWLHCEILCREAEQLLAK
jgi:tetratricopeptide (TPR) repeat protein/tRNA A-37 threonylcarbamoyl transferase component Bud32